MSIRVEHNIGGLARDLEAMPAKAAGALARTLRSKATEGNRIAADFARESAGSHGKLYPDAFEAEPITALSWEFGPLSDRPQGDMDFEHGSGRQSTPHLDLARAADLIAPELEAAVGRDVDGLFW